LSRSVQEAQLDQKGATRHLSAPPSPRVAGTPCMVRPVASRSSIKQHAPPPGVMASMWTWSSALPYSRFVSKRVRPIRQLPRLAQRHQRLVQFQRQRRREQEAPRLGRGHDVDGSTPGVGWPGAEPRAQNAWGAVRSGVMSLNTMPGFGKSGISRMYACRSMPGPLIAPYSAVYELSPREATMPLSLRRATVADAAVLADYNARLAQGERGPRPRSRQPRRRRRRRLADPTRAATSSPRRTVPSSAN